MDLLAIQGTLKSLLQHHSSKSSILWRSAFFMVQLSHPYMTTGKTIALTRWTFVGRVMSLFFNTLSRLVIAFLPRNKRLLISWLQSPSTVILGPKKIKSFTASIVSPSMCHEVMGLDFMILVFECGVSRQLFHSLSPSSRGSFVPFAFCHKDGVICISVVIDISPCNLDSSLCFMLYQILSKYPLELAYSYLSPFSCLCSNLCYSQLHQLPFSSQLMCVDNEMGWIDNQWNNMPSKINKEIIKNEYNMNSRIYC